MCEQVPPVSAKFRLRTMKGAMARPLSDGSRHSVGKSKVLLIMLALIMDTLQPKEGIAEGRIGPDR